MNKNHIAVISKKNDGILEFTREEISNNYIDVLNKLEEMLNNPNRTVLDMQQCFSNSFRRKEYFNLCLQYSYSASYIGGVGYPDLLTYDEYNDMLKKKKDELVNQYLQYEQVEKELLNWRNELKFTFFNKCKIYIDACNFSITSSKIKNNPQTIMQSSEVIGWTNYEYKVNEDVVISVATNFGYGYSSYFLLMMKYKGIEILPYSALIHYYYANVLELRRYTRQYNTERDSWNIAFDFVVDSANMAKSDPGKFINIFIVNEINEMVSGLRNIANSPDTEIKRFIKNAKNERVLNGFCYRVRNIGYEEKGEYEVYQNEMNIAFKAEKITGALLFLEKLSELTKILPSIQNSIDEIKRLNNNLMPELEDRILKIRNSIDEQREQLKRHEVLLENINKQMETHTENIKKLKGACENSDEKSQVENKYKLENPHYVQLCSEKEKLQVKIDEINTHIRKRNNFIEHLKECVERIQTYVLAA